MTGVSEPPAAVVMGRDYLDNPKPSTVKMDFSKIILRIFIHRGGTATLTAFCG